MHVLAYRAHLRIHWLKHRFVNKTYMIEDVTLCLQETLQCFRFDFNVLPYELLHLRI